VSTWVLLRGLTREARHWSDLPERLRAFGVEEKIVLADLPGSGTHAHMRVPARVPEIVDFVRADLFSRGYRPPFSVMALSLGAMVAAAWAQRAPREIDRLVLINTSMRPFSGPAMRLRPRALPELACAALRWRSRPDAEAAIHTLTCNRQDQRRSDLENWVAIYRSAPVTRANALRQFLSAARFKADDATPRCPILILSSRGDALVQPACSLSIAKAWGAMHREHPWAGHDLPHDDPDWLAETVARWADALTNTASNCG
jgi:pimeloyl-ACP methyl ester carboxylesterase